MIAFLLAACGSDPNSSSTDQNSASATGELAIAFQSRGEGEIEPCG